MSTAKAIDATKNLEDGPRADEDLDRKDQKGTKAPEQASSDDPPKGSMASTKGNQGRDYDLAGRMASMNIAKPINFLEEDDEDSSKEPEKILDRESNGMNNEKQDFDDTPAEDEIVFGFSNIDNYKSVSTFEDLGLRQEIIDSIYSVGFERPSRIQEKAMPLLLAENPKNFIGQSQSGTGKTAMLSIVSVSRVDLGMKCPQVICLSPTRELAIQTYNFIKKLADRLGITTLCAVNDSRLTSEDFCCQIIVGTPGTMANYVSRMALQTKSLKLFIIDEADHIISAQSMCDQTMRIKRFVPPTTQVIFLSATYTSNIMKYAERFASNAEKVSLKPSDLSVEGITQLYMACNDSLQRYDVLSTIYGLLTIGQSIVFCQKKVTADNVGHRLRKDGHICDVLHSGNLPEERDLIMDKFRKGDIKVLISSNVVSRGIDIEQVNVVVNFDIPLDANNRPDPDTYLHRIGRTGRFGRSGISISFVYDKKSYSDMMSIQNYFGKKITKIETNSMTQIEKQLKEAIGK